MFLVSECRAGVNWRNEYPIDTVAADENHGDQAASVEGVQQLQALDRGNAQPAIAADAA
jgi:hypothetical protein